MQANVRGASVMQPPAAQPSERSVAQLGNEAFSALAETEVQPVRNGVATLSGTAMSEGCVPLSHVYLKAMQQALLHAVVVFSAVQGMAGW